MLKRIFMLICIIALQRIQAQNQELYDPYTPEYFTGTDPAWLQDIQKNPRGVNFFEMEKKFQEWLATDPDARKKTPEKKPAVNFYRRWQRAYKPFVNEKGEIVLPTKEEYFRKINEQNQRSQQNIKAARRRKRSTPGVSSNKWKNIGPFSTARNTPNDPYQASYDSHANVFRIDVSKTNSNTLYCGAETGVVFKTTNKGLKWEACCPTFNFGSKILSIKIDPTNENIVWVGSDIGLFVTKDGGNSFHRIGEFNISSKVNSIRINKEDTRIVSVATEDGFYYSSNGGVSFTKTLDGKCYDHELKPNANQKVYLLAQKRGTYEAMFYTSSNGGFTFDQGTQILPNVKFGRLAVSNALGGEDYVYALVNIFDYSYDYGAPHIVQSKNGGTTWVDKTGREDNKYGYKNTFCPSIDGRNGGQGFYDMMIGVSDTNPEHVIFGLCSAYRSTTGGSGGYYTNSLGGYCNPNLPGNPRIHPDMQDIAISGDEVWIANDGGIKYSDNFFANRSGENRINGVYTADFHGFGQGWNEDVMAGGRWHNGDAVMINNESYNYGKISVYVGGVEQSTGYVMLSNPKRVYFSDSGMFTMPESISGSVTQNSNRFGVQPYEQLRSYGFLGTDPRYAQRILYHPKEPSPWSFYPSYQIWETKDEGSNSHQIYDTKGEGISNIEFARSNPNTIYACGKHHIFKSQDNGKNWVELNIPNPSGTTSYLSVDPKNENKLWVVQSNTKRGVQYSEDGGLTWSNPLNDELNEIEFRWVVLAGDEKNGVYLGTEEGAFVYYKDDDLSDWINYSEGLPPAARLTRLVPFFKEGKLRAATSQGIWEIPLYREHFVPVAQPIALDLAGPELADANTPVHFDSYSIVNQNGATWKWTFHPKPCLVIGETKRNPVVTFRYNGKYDVTLEVTTPEGTHSRTIKDMIIVTNGENRADSDNGNTSCVNNDGNVSVSTGNGNTSNTNNNLVEKILISNAFSPNNDGINDTWSIVGIKKYKNNFIEIFNTQGRKVFSTINYQNNWSGIGDNGEKLPQGVYFFVIHLNDESNRVYEGELYINY